MKNLQNNKTHVITVVTAIVKVVAIVYYELSEQEFHYIYPSIRKT